MTVITGSTLFTVRDIHTPQKKNSRAETDGDHRLVDWNKLVAVTGILEITAVQCKQIRENHKFHQRG
jgi:hypothetical protein